jgi:dienelactone hydrolase
MLQFMKNVLFALTALVCGALGSTASAQAVISKDIEYSVGGKTMQGYVSSPAAADKKRPVVVIVHDWNGIDAYEKMRADMVAKLGYIAFCADIYGKGIRPANTQESAAEAGKYYGDPALFRQRVNGAVDFAKTLPGANKNKVVAMGYCFGGTAVLELARSGADVLGVASFHGGLKTTMPAAKGVFKGDALILHGEADTAVPPAEVEAFKKEFGAAEIDFDLITYPGAVHGFTVQGPRYNEAADLDSWKRLEAYLKAKFK